MEKDYIHPEAVEEDKQVYTPEYEVPPPRKHFISSMEPLKTEQPLGDVYDIYGMASSVHSKITDMTRDYTLAKYNSGIINEKLPKFIREQRKVMRILKSFLLVPEETLKRRFWYDPEYVERAKRTMTKCYNDCAELFLGELDEMVIISRAGKGEVIKAMLMHGKSKEEQDEYNVAVDADTIGGKLKERRS